MKLPSKRSNTTGLLKGCPNYQCFEPPIKNFIYFDFRDQIDVTHINTFKTQDTVWTLLKTLCTDSQVEVPTWVAYNSVIANANPLTLVSTLPIINGSPTEWDNLYTAIREAENLRRELLPEQKTIISFNFQLYAKAVLLQAKPEIRNNYIFSMGELHVVFCFLKVLGKMIDGSGLDQAFEESRKFSLQCIIVDVLQNLICF